MLGTSMGCAARQRPTLALRPRPGMGNLLQARKPQRKVTPMPTQRGQISVDNTGVGNHQGGPWQPQEWEEQGQSFLESAEGVWPASGTGPWVLRAIIQKQVSLQRCHGRKPPGSWPVDGTECRRRMAPLMGSGLASGAVHCCLGTGGRRTLACKEAQEPWI